jgi:hypothetical protein
MEIPWADDWESIGCSLIICWPKFVTPDELGDNFELFAPTLKFFTTHKNKLKYLSVQDSISNTLYIEFTPMGLLHKHNKYLKNLTIIGQVTCLTYRPILSNLEAIELLSRVLVLHTNLN